jgi:hypothetical protein
MNRNLPSKSAVGRAALEAVNKFEGSEGDKLSGAERKLLDRLKSKKWFDNLGLAWLAIQKHSKGTDDDQQIIASIFDAFRSATIASKTRGAWGQRVTYFGKVRNAITILEKFLDEFERPGLLGITPREQLVLGLSWLKDSLHNTELFEESERRTISRNSGSIKGQCAMFAAYMAWRLRALFDSPCHSAVAALTEIAFGTDFGSEQASDAERDHARPVVGPLNEQPRAQLKHRTRRVGRRRPQKQS